MDNEQLRDALDGLFAYDMGATDSGIHDVALKCAVKGVIAIIPPADLTRMIRDMWMSEEAIAQGYTVADAYEFMQWLGDEMDYDL